MQELTLGKGEEPECVLFHDLYFSNCFVPMIGTGFEARRGGRTYRAESR